MAIVGTTKYTMNQADVLLALAEYFNRQTGLDVKPEDFKLNIIDSYAGDDYYGTGPGYEPAYIKEVSITV